MNLSLTGQNVSSNSGKTCTHSYKLLASYADILRLVTRSSPRGEERVTSLRTSAWEANKLPYVGRFSKIAQTNLSTKDRDIPDKSPKTDFTIPYLPSESISKSKHEKTVQMETDFSAAKTRNSKVATFWVPETTKRPRCITVRENGSLRQLLKRYCKADLDVVGLCYV